MVNDIKEVSVETKVWNPSTLKWMCIFLSAFSAILLYIINFYKLNHPKKMQFTLFGITATIITMILALLLPEGTIFSILILMINIVVAIFFSAQQKEFYNKFIQNGGRKASSFVAWILGIVFLIAFIVLFGVLSFTLQKIGLVKLS
jgi:hypothetical protein